MPMLSDDLVQDFVDRVCGATDAAADRFPDRLPRDFMTTSDDYWSMFVGIGAILQNGGDSSRIPGYLRDAADDIEKQLLKHGRMFTEDERTDMRAAAAELRELADQKGALVA
ncbi:MAG: hypothetical protein F4Y83_03725 [Acidimicrobiia bacterium]|nr:hypothetical protein [Acidimicrobiia bacterium]MYA40084.1 hypothetical protein [Acidimicrobiia bacterium]MYG92791.1 hypothetical protein [Acidimicrobiia bacterium]MYH05128.1 hypothetical protein [Acidimicrobiia bacterium]MYK56909.1 hypothetical protein [Acidimicrobiia bacterium]